MQRLAVQLSIPICGACPGVKVNVYGTHVNAGAVGNVNPAGLRTVYRPEEADFVVDMLVVRVELPNARRDESQRKCEPKWL